MGFAVSVYRAREQGATTRNSGLYCEESQRSYRVREVCIAAENPYVTGINSWPLRLSGERAARPWRKPNRAARQGSTCRPRHRGPRDDASTLGSPVLLPTSRVQCRQSFADIVRIPPCQASETPVASLDQGISFNPRGSQSAQLKRRSTPASTSARGGHVGPRRTHPNRENRRCLQPGIFRLNGSGVP